MSRDANSHGTARSFPALGAPRGTGGFIVLDGRQEFHWEEGALKAEFAIPSEHALILEVRRRREGLVSASPEKSAI